MTKKSGVKSQCRQSFRAARMEPEVVENKSAHEELNLTIDLSMCVNDRAV